MFWGSYGVGVASFGVRCSKTSWAMALKQG